MAIYNNRQQASLNRQGGINWPSILGMLLALFVVGAFVVWLRSDQPLDGGDDGPEIPVADETPSATASPQETPVVEEASPQGTPTTATQNPSPEADDNAGSTEPATSTPILVAQSTAIATFTLAPSDAQPPEPSQSVPTADPNLPENNDAPQGESEQASPTVEPTFTLPPSATIAVDQEEERTDSAVSVSATETTAEPQPIATVPPTEPAAATQTAMPTQSAAATEPPAAQPAAATEPPTATAVPTEPPTATLPPTATNTPFVPTNTPFVPTNTPFVPTNTPFVPTKTPFPTYTPFVPTQPPPTYTPVPVQRNVGISLLAPAENGIVKNNEAQFRVQVYGFENGDRLQLRASIDQNNLFNEGISFTFDGSAYVANLNYRPGNAGFGKDYYWQVLVIGPDGSTLATSNIWQFRWEEPTGP